MKKCFLTTAILVGFIITAFAQTKTIQIRLNGIFMGECGNNNNHCYHEPVAGIVQLYLASISPTNVVMIPPVQQPQNPVIWESPDYQLVCSNINVWYAGTQGTSVGAEDRYTTQTPAPIANNIWKTFYFQVSEQDWQNNKYQMRLKLRLGNKHQDNPFASTGQHWTDDEFPTLDFSRSQYRQGYSELRNFGPFETYSDRCHEYWVQFQVDVY